MPAKQHLMHGRDHLPNGADPIPGLPPNPAGGDSLDSLILAAVPDGFWKLNESTGHVAADSSGYGQDLSTTSPEVDPLWGAPAGPPGQPAANFQTGTGGFGGTASRVSRSWASITGSFTAGIWVKRNDTTSSYVMGQGAVGRSPFTNGWQLEITAGPLPNVWMGGLGETDLQALNPLAPGVWAFLAVSYDAAATVAKFYVNGLLNATSVPFTFNPATGPLWIGHDDSPGGVAIIGARFTGSYAFLVNRALTGSELLAINDSTVPIDRTNYVLTVNGSGQQEWLPPTIEVQY